MSDPIEIRIQDQVSPSVLGKLDQIAKKSRDGFANIERLKAALKSIDSAAINALSLAQSRAQKAMNDSAIIAARLAVLTQRQASAAAQAASAQQRLQAASTQTATAQQNLATATARTTTEQARSAAATANAAAAQTRAASAALRLQQQQAALANSSASLARQGEALKRQLFPLYAAQQQYNEALARANTLHKAGAIDARTYVVALSAAEAKLESAAAASRVFNAAQAATGRAAQLNRAHLVNLGFQLNDVAVSLASGQNPLLVLAQQGSQIGGIASQAGVGLGRLAAAAGRMLLPFVPFVAVLGTALLAMKLLASEASKGAHLDEFARDLGASEKQIKDLNLGVVTLMDTVRGLFKTLDEVVGAKSFFGPLWEDAKNIFTSILKFVGTVFSSIISLGRATIETLVVAIQVLPDRWGLTFANIINSGRELFEGFANSAIDSINKIIDALNLLAGEQAFNPVEHLDLGRIDTSKFEAAGVDLSQVFVDSYMDNTKGNQQAIDGFLAKWQANSIVAAKERISKALDKPIETRAQSLAKINAELDNELQRLFALRPARDAQARYDQIEEQMIGKRIHLHADETAALQRKIAAIEAAKFVQAQFDRIYEASVEPLRTYAATLDAAQKLIRLNPQYQQAASRAVIQAQEAYLSSLDPLRQINKELDEQNTLLALLPRQREIEAQMQQVANQKLAEGIILTQQETQALRERLITQQQLNIASQAEAQIWDNTRGAREKYIADLDAIAKLRNNKTITGGQAAQEIIRANPELDFTNTQTATEARVQQFDDMYKQIDDLRQRHLINEQTAAALQTRIWQQQQEAQLSTASNFFGQLSQLQRSENSKIAKIGKAAAIAKAIIDTYSAATGAYASLASIPIIGPGLGIAAATAAIAAGLANVQAIRSQPAGFARGGYTGDMPRNAVAGAVHGQEFVMNAAATKRVGVANLQKLQKGGGFGELNLTIENYGTSKAFDVERISESEIRIIARDEAERAVVEQAPRVMSAELGNPNSRFSKSLGRNTNASRKR